LLENYPWLPDLQVLHLSLARCQLPHRFKAQVCQKLVHLYREHQEQNHHFSLVVVQLEQMQE